MHQRAISSEPELARLADDAARKANWKRWGPYLSARQWGTVREDYSKDGDCWNYFPHEHARSRTYRWGEDGLLGLTDRQGRLCFSIALWNGADRILKERLFGLTNGQGNHGEDVKEQYFYLESTPTHSWMHALYKYPQREFPYARLVEESARRSKDEPEYELLDTGVFDDDRYFDVFLTYAKAGPDDVLIEIKIENRARTAAPLVVLPTVWFRNTWSWGNAEEGRTERPRLGRLDPNTLWIEEHSLGAMQMKLQAPVGAERCEQLFTENVSNARLLWGSENESPYVKDAFHDYVIANKREVVNPDGVGTKGAWLVAYEIEAGGSRTLRLRLSPRDLAPPRAFGDEFGRVMAARKSEHDAFFDGILAPEANADERRVIRQAYAGLLWSKQFYHYAVDTWLQGDPAQPAPPAERKDGRNRDWRHLYNRDVLSMPDTWEYPWFAAWDTAFHMAAMAKVDPHFAKEQLLLFLREWYMHPNGQIPAYEFNFGDVNPPVHAAACWRVYKISGKKGERDRTFLARAFHKLLINFTWWVNRKDPFGNHLFAGGFLGLDNIGVFDRNRPLPGGGQLVQADGTAWMAFYCATMFSMAVELAHGDPAYEDVASKFFEHFVAICDAMNRLGGNGLWDEEDGFYYDEIVVGGEPIPLRLRSMVGLVPLFTAEVVAFDDIANLPKLRHRIEWFLKHRTDLKDTISYLEFDAVSGRGLLAIPSRERLIRVLRYVLDENEFLSPYGLRSLSRVHKDKPYRLNIGGEEFTAAYEPAESRNGLFGGNSNWRGPIWFPLNHLFIEVLERYHHAYGDSLKVECPTGSGRFMDLSAVAQFLRARLASLFLADASGRRPCHGAASKFATDPHWKDLVHFHEYFHGDDGSGLGASHQTGWTALIAPTLQSLARSRAAGHNAPRREPLVGRGAKRPRTRRT